RRLERPGGVRVEENPLAGDLVAAVLAERLLRERLVDQDVVRNLPAVGTDGGAEDELLAASGEGAHVALRLRRAVADHVDDDIEAFRAETSFECRKIVAIAGDLTDFAAGDRVVALSAVEHDDVRAAGVEVLDDAHADQPRAADEEDAHVAHHSGGTAAGGL